MKMTMKILWLAAVLTLCVGATASAYELTAAQSEHGQVGFSVDGTARTTAEAGEMVAITITPEEGYSAKDVTARAYTTWEAANARRLAPGLLDDIAVTKDNDGTWTFTMPEANVLVEASYTKNVQDAVLTLSETTDNAETISTADGKVYDVALTRTLQAGGWNTFCAPFSTATPSGWTVKELTSSELNSTTGELTLNFGNAASIEAGKPYLVKVDANVANPTFNGVTISSTTTTTETTAVDFVPVMNPTNLTGGDKTVLFVSGGNKLTYPSADGNIYGFRAYFQLKGEVAAQARAFHMSFDDDATGIVTVLSDEPTTASGTYTLDGRRIEGQPTQKGVYIVNGKKTIIK